MASVQEKLKQKRISIDTWNIREQLCLASSVLKAGDQNWISVSRSLKPIADKDSMRPSDWFSQKSCAQQYAYLLENADIPKRKKRESGETTSQFIVRRLTQDRITELSKILTSQREEYFQLRNEINLLKYGRVSDEKLQKMWLVIEEEKKEHEQKNKIQVFLTNKYQLNKEEKSTQILDTQNLKKKVSDTVVENQEVKDSCSENEQKRNKNEKSSLLTNLLKATTSKTQIQMPTNSSTIVNFLCSDPKSSEPILVQNVPVHLQQNIANVNMNMTHERPSVSAPTLSMLLEQPTSESQRALPQIQNTSTLVNTKNSQNSVESPNTIRTRSYASSQTNVTQTQIVQVQQITPNSDLSNTVVPQSISNSIDEVIPKVIHMNKDEINEIIGDIEELIKEEITSSPKKLEPSSETKVKIIDDTNKQISTVTVEERSKPRNVDDSVSLSNSPSSEILLEEIDSSSSNIAEIIGTAIGSVESKINVDVIENVGKTVEPKLKISNNSSKELEKLDADEDSKIERPIKATKEVLTNQIDEIEEEKMKYLISKDPKVYEEVNEDCNMKELVTDPINTDGKKMNKQECVIYENKNTSSDNKVQISKISNISVNSSKMNDFSNQKEKNTQFQDHTEILKDEKMSDDISIEEAEKAENKEFAADKVNVMFKSNTKFLKNDYKNVVEIVDEKSGILKSKLEVKDKKADFMEVVQDSGSKEREENENENETTEEEKNVLENCENKLLAKNIIVVKEEKLVDVKKEVIDNENLNDNNKIGELKVKQKKEDMENSFNISNKVDKDIKKEIDYDSIKKENIESIGTVEDLDEEEPTLSKLSGGRVIKTYSKKQNMTVDSEPENETSGETADYRAWKKSIMLVYNRLATHKNASIFLRPITEDQAPGYHSIIFRPMDLWTIKKNIDNGTIRTTAHFQRDVMLMFQNAIMFNKCNTIVHKMTLEMQEECLQHMQVLVRAAGESSFRRETRTAASISNETTESSLKRKWIHITSCPHDAENIRLKKRRKSEND